MNYVFIFLIINLLTTIHLIDRYLCYTARYKEIAQDLKDMRKTTSDTSLYVSEQISGLEIFTRSNIEKMENLIDLFGIDILEVKKMVEESKAKKTKTKENK